MLSGGSMDVFYPPTKHYEYGTRPKIFLAGGITNCPDWQSVILQHLSKHDVVVYNPRRSDWRQDNDVREQIHWERESLLGADIILFWFSKGSVNPIALLELGAYGLATDVPLFIGIDYGYERDIDVRIQTELARPDVHIEDSLIGLYMRVQEYLNGIGY